MFLFIILSVFNFLGYYTGFYTIYEYKYMFWLEPTIDIYFILKIIQYTIYNRMLKNLIHFETQNLQIKLKNDLDAY
jgi:hypothetical protein